MSTYVFDQAWQKERDRLSALESLYRRRVPPVAGRSRRRGRMAVPGGRLLARGGIALWLADRVGETGHVLATDLDTRFLDGHGRANLEVRTHNIVTDPLDEAAFDVIHARAVVEHVADREQVLKRLVAALRPGGWLLIEEVDFGGATAGMLAQYVTAPAAGRGRHGADLPRHRERVLRDRRRSVVRQAAGRCADRCRARPASPRSCMRRWCPAATSSGRGAASSSSPSGSSPPASHRRGRRVVPRRQREGRTSTTFRR